MVNISTPLVLRSRVVNNLSFVGRRYSTGPRPLEAPRYDSVLSGRVILSRLFLFMILTTDLCISPLICKTTTSSPIEVMFPSTTLCLTIRTTTVITYTDSVLLVSKVSRN